MMVNTSTCWNFLVSQLFSYDRTIHSMWEYASMILWSAWFQFFHPGRQRSMREYTSMMTVILEIAYDDQEQPVDEELVSVDIILPIFLAPFWSGDWMKTYFFAFLKLLLYKFPIRLGRQSNCWVLPWSCKHTGTRTNPSQVRTNPNLHWSCKHTGTRTNLNQVKYKSRTNPKAQVKCKKVQMTF